MLTRLRSGAPVRWNDLQDRLWFIPALMTIAAALLAFVMVWIDQNLLGQRRPESDWLFGAGASGAREVLSAIASTTITVTGLVFSITIVALQLASSQFTPRVLRTFTGDRGNQLVLGIFIATFTYALLVLRTVREGANDGAIAFVPSAAVTVALILTGASVGFLIYYISHAADSIRASVIIDRATQDTLGVVRRQYPEATDDAVNESDVPSGLSSGLTNVRASRAGFVQDVNEDHLLAVLQSENLALELTVYMGQFVHVGSVIARAWPTDRVDAKALDDHVNGALILGSERTLHADVELGIRQLADIAVKALSPGINDPTTATICIDRLGQVLVEIASRPEQAVVRYGDDGRGTLYRPRLRWETVVRAAFEEIRHYGAGDPMVAQHLSRALRRLIDVVPAGRVPALVDQRGAVIAAARRELSDPDQLARIESAS